MERHNLFTPDKGEYVRIRRADYNGRCILCAVVEGASDVENLELARSGGFVITLNLYPYNPGHLMVFPARHVEDPRSLAAEELAQLSVLQNLALDILSREYRPAGFNVGFNLGSAAGASLPHLHLHIVPRYPHELGVVDILSGAKIIIENPQKTRQKLRNAFAAALLK